MRERVEAAREGAGFGGPATAAIAALECVCAQGRKAELVDAVTQAMKGLADAESEAAGAAGEAVELGVELGDFGGRGSWVERGDFGGRRSWARLSALELLGGWRSWDLRAGTPHDYLSS